MRHLSWVKKINRIRALVLLSTIGLVAIGITLWNLSLQDATAASQMRQRVAVMDRQSKKAVQEKKDVIKKAPDTFREAAKQATLLANIETRLVHFQFDGNKSDPAQVTQNRKDQATFATLVKGTDNGAWNPQTTPWYTNATWTTVYLKSMNSGKDTVPCAFALKGKHGVLMGLVTADYDPSVHIFQNIHVYATTAGQKDQPQLIE